MRRFLDWAAFRIEWCWLGWKMRWWWVFSPEKLWPKPEKLDGDFVKRDGTRSDTYEMWP